MGLVHAQYQPDPDVHAERANICQPRSRVPQRRTGGSNPSHRTGYNGFNSTVSFYSATTGIVATGSGGPGTVTVDLYATSAGATTLTLVGSTGTEAQYLSLSLSTSLPTLTQGQNSATAHALGRVTGVQKGMMLSPTTRMGWPAERQWSPAPIESPAPKPWVKVTPVEGANIDLRISKDTLLDLGPFERNSSKAAKAVSLEVGQLRIDPGVTLAVQSTHRVELMVKGDVDIAGKIRSLAPELAITAEGHINVSDTGSMDASGSAGSAGGPGSNIDATSGAIEGAPGNGGNGGQGDQGGSSGAGAGGLYGGGGASTANGQNGVSQAAPGTANGDPTWVAATYPDSSVTGGGTAGGSNGTSGAQAPDGSHWSTGYYKPAAPLTGVSSGANPQSPGGGSGASGGDDACITAFGPCNEYTYSGGGGGGGGGGGAGSIYLTASNIVVSGSLTAIGGAGGPAGMAEMVRRTGFGLSIHIPTPSFRSLGRVEAAALEAQEVI